MTKDFSLFNPSSPAPACLACAPDLTALFDGEADDAATRRACAHLEGCPSCAAAYRDWAKNRTLLRDVVPTPLPPLLPERLLITCRLEGLARARRMAHDLPRRAEESLSNPSMDAPALPPSSPRLAWAHHTRAFAGVAALAVPVMAASLMMFLARAPQTELPAPAANLSAATPERAPAAPANRLAQLPPDNAPIEAAPPTVPSRIVSRRIELRAHSAEASSPSIVAATSSARRKSRAPRVLIGARVRLASVGVGRRFKRATPAPQVLLADFEVGVRPSMARPLTRVALGRARRLRSFNVAHRTNLERVAGRVASSAPNRGAQAAAIKVLSARRIEAVTRIPRLAMADAKRPSSETAASDGDEALFGVGDNRPEELSQVVDNYRAALIADADSES